MSSHPVNYWMKLIAGNRRKSFLTFQSYISSSGAYNRRRELHSLFHNFVLFSAQSDVYDSLQRLQGFASDIFPLLIVLGVMMQEEPLLETAFAVAGAFKLWHLLSQSLCTFSCTGCLLPLSHMQCLRLEWNPGVFLVRFFREERAQQSHLGTD